jgi:hypothetical protein
MNNTQKDVPLWLKTPITESRCLSPGGEPSAPPAQFDSAQTLLEEKVDDEPGFPGGLPIHELETLGYSSFNFSKFWRAKWKCGW